MDYAHSLRTLAERAFGDKKEWNDTVDSVFKDQLWNEMNSTLKVALSLYVADDYNEIIKKATLLESSLGVNEQTNVARQYDERNKREVTCYICQGKGHLSRDCKKSPRKAGNQARIELQNAIGVV